MEKMTRRLDYLPFQSKTWHTETVVGTYEQIADRATIISWNQSCAVSICHTDEKGHGFPDETFGDWGSIRTTSESQALRAMDREPARPFVSPRRLAA